MLVRDIAVKPIAGALGAVIEGIDLGRKQDDDTVSFIRKALLDHCAILFYDQNMAPEQHIAFGRRFGMLNVHEYAKAMDRPTTSDGP